MARHIATLVVFLAALAHWGDAAACTCLRPVLPDLYKDSTHVFLGEVVKIELLTTDPVHGQEVTYVATLGRVETFKGSSSAEARVTFTGTYAEPGRPIPRESVVDEATGETLEIVVVGGCALGMAAGAKYYIFEKRGEPLHYSGWCAQRVMHESLIALDSLRSLRDAR